MRTLLGAESQGLGLYSPDALQTLKPGARLLFADPLTREFKLTLSLERAPNLSDFEPFPMTVPGTTINPEGEIEFRFASPDPAAFFRLKAR